MNLKTGLCLIVSLVIVIGVRAQVVPDAMGYVHPKILVQSGTAINGTGHYELKFYKGNDTFIVNNNTADWYLGQDSGLSWDQPLVFINNSTKKIRVNAINAENCQYVKILGYGSDSTYGFEFYGGGVTGSFHGMMKGIEIMGCRFTGGVNGGVWFKTEVGNACDYYNYYGVVDTDPGHLKYKDIYQYIAQGNKPYDSIYFRHNKIDSCGGEGFYGMTTDYILPNGTWRDAIPCLSNQRLAPTQCRNYHVDSNEVWTCGRTGIQVSQGYATGGNNTINGNYVHNIGYEYSVTHDPSAFNQGKGISIGWHTQNMEVAYNFVDTTFNYNYDMEEAVNVHHNTGDHVGKIYYNNILTTNPQDIHAFIGYANNTAINPMKINSNQMKATINGGRKFVVYGGPKFLTSGNDTCFNNAAILIAATPFVANPTCTGVDTVCHDSTYKKYYDSIVTTTVTKQIPYDSTVFKTDTTFFKPIRLLTGGTRSMVRITKGSYVTYHLVRDTTYDTTYTCMNCANKDTTVQVCIITGSNVMNKGEATELSNFVFNYKYEMKL